MSFALPPIWLDYRWVFTNLRINHFCTELGDMRCLKYISIGYPTPDKKGWVKFGGRVAQIAEFFSHDEILSFPNLAQALNRFRANTSGREVRVVSPKADFVRLAWQSCSLYIIYYRYGWSCSAVFNHSGYAPNMPSQSLGAFLREFKEAYKSSLYRSQRLSTNNIGLASFFQLAVGYAGIDNQGNEGRPGNSSRNATDKVRSFNRLNLLLLVSALFGVSCFIVGVRLNFYGVDHALLNLTMIGWGLIALGTMLVLLPLLMLFVQLILSRLDDTVTHKYTLTSSNYCNTVISIGRTQMANILSIEKQVAIISALAEGSGIRQIERITGVHRDTLMRLGVRAGAGVREPVRKQNPESSLSTCAYPIG
jgi:hypothetical protein